MAKYDIPVFRLGYMPSLRHTDIDFSDVVSLTKQADADACDINNIMAQYEKTGLVAHTSRYQGEYRDLGDSISFHEALNQVIAAQDAFDSLPAHIRSRFANDPAQFLDFVSTEDNRAEMEKLGLLPSTGASAPQNADEVPVEVAPKARKLDPSKLKKASSPPAEEGD